MPRLSPEQAAAISAVEWLLAPPAQPAEGRTTALAIAIIRLAAAHPGRAIPVRDHHPRSETLPLTIQGFVEADPILRNVCRWRDLRRTVGAPELAFDLTTPIRNWMPRDWEMPERPRMRIRDVPRALSLDPRWTTLRTAPTTQDGDDLPRPRNDLLDAFTYALEAEQTSLTARQVDEARRLTMPKSRTLWDHLEEDES